MSHNGSGVILLTTALLSLMACDRGTAPVSPMSSSTVEPTRTDACTSTGSRQLVEEFLDRAESGEDARLLVKTFIAEEPEFQWFSTRERIGMATAEDRSSLAQYLEDRRRRGVAQEIERFSFNAFDEDRGIGHFDFTIVETSDGETELRYPGKGALACDVAKIIVWSEGGTPA